MNRPSILPRQPVPTLSVPLLDNKVWTLAEQTPEHFTLIVFYRGLHCPICRTYLTELNALHAEFVARGVSVVAISSDSEARARDAHGQWKLDQLDIGHSLDAATAAAWRLFRSAGRGKTSIGIEEPAEFSEPGIFLVRADGTLYWSSIQTMPFARPHFRDMLGALDFVIKNNYPARGELA